MMEITGYADALSARPGETIRFMINCQRSRYRADLVRLRCGDTNPNGPGFSEKIIKSNINRTYPGRRQQIEAGSYGVVPHHETLNGLQSMSVQAMIWPTTPQKGPQSIVSKYSEKKEAGFILGIDEKGALCLVIGDGNGVRQLISTDCPLVEREWYFVAATFNAGVVVLYQESANTYPGMNSSRTVQTKTRIPSLGTNIAPLMFAAHCSGKQGQHLGNHFNGKIEAPSLANRALSRAELEMSRSSLIPGALSTFITASWNFSIDISGISVKDVSSNNLHGKTINLPTRGMTGSTWTGRNMDWKSVPEEYGAIHFHDDDVYDANWSVDFELEVPTRIKSGLYAARIRSGKSEEYIPFVVRAAPGREKRIGLLLPTASYMAYANEHMATDVGLAQLLGGRIPTLNPQDLFLAKHREYGASCYDSHSDGSGVCYSSRLRPVLNMRPKYTEWLGGKGSTLWQFNADTHITDWLDACSYEYDIFTDEDLHNEGLDLLRHYQVVLSGTHPEYHTLDMWDAMKAYQGQGGRLMYLGGNGWYWRIAFHPSLPGVIEVRRNEGGTRGWRAEPGEYYHSFTGEYGGLWRSQGRPPQQIVGTGFTAQGFDVSAPYKRLPDSFDPRAAFIFKDVAKDELIGDFGLIGGGAAGLELDRADYSLGTPPNTLVLATSQGRHTDIYLLVCEEILITQPGLGGTEHPLVRADMVFYETPNGGGVWSPGSIAWSGSLSHNNYNNNVSQITRNVLNRFLDETTFEC